MTAIRFVLKMVKADGDYFHSNPKFYPNGPETETQKVNFGKDKAKNKYIPKRGFKLIRFWEEDILSWNFLNILGRKLDEIRRNS